MVSVFTYPDVNTREVGRTRDKRRKPRREAEWFSALHFFYKITNERGTKTVFTYTHVKWFYGQSEHAYYLHYFIILFVVYFARLARNFATSALPSQHSKSHVQLDLN